MKLIVRGTAVLVIVFLLAVFAGCEPSSSSNTNAGGNFSNSRNVNDNGNDNDGDNDNNDNYLDDSLNNNHNVNLNNNHNINLNNNHNVNLNNNRNGNLNNNNNNNSSRKALGSPGTPITTVCEAMASRAAEVCSDEDQKAAWQTEARADPDGFREGCFDKGSLKAMSSEGLDKLAGDIGAAADCDGLKTVVGDLMD